MNIHISHHARPPMRREQAVDQALQAVGFVDDDLGVLGQFAGFDFHLQQLRCAADTAQRVFDFVRQISHQLLVGLRLLCQALFAVLPGLLLHRQQFNNELSGVFGLRNDHVHRQGLTVEPLDPGVVAQRSKLVAADAAERTQEVRWLGQIVR